MQQGDIFWVELEEPTGELHGIQELGHEARPCCVASG